MMKVVRVLLPLIVVGIGLLAAWWLVRYSKQVETVPTTFQPPLIDVVEASARSHRMSVPSQGNVMARTEIDLVAEVSGKVEKISPSLAAGGFFEKGEILVRVDSRDYELALAQAQARLVQAQVAVTREEAEALVARREWERLGQGKPGTLLLRGPQLAEAHAGVDSAKAAVEQARRDLERCVMKAPFAGRVASRNVDVGQFISRGAPVAHLYAVDFAEVVLPLSVHELAFVDLPIAFRGEGRPDDHPEVILRTDFAGKTHSWRGRIVRTEGRIDTRTRMVKAVARVENPYGRDDQRKRPPLSVGLHVKAEILGRKLERVFVIPREAVRKREFVWIVDENNRLRETPVKVLRFARDTAVVESGIADGDRLCTSQLDIFVDGMRVRVRDRDAEATTTSSHPGKLQPGGE